MTRSFRAPGARAIPRTLLLACAASLGTGILLSACSAAPQMSAARTAGAPHVAAPTANGPAFRAEAGASGSGSRSTGRLATVVLPSQSIIYTAHLAIRAKDVQAAAAKATSIATDAGGYVSSQQETIPPGRHQVPEVSLVLKIPVAAYSTTLTKLSAADLGKRISFGQNAQDVTQQVADVNSRVTSAEAAIRQLRALLSKAGSVGALLSVQEEINNQEANLEALLAQQRTLAHQTSYATVSVTMLGKHAVFVKKPAKIPGFLAGLRGGWHALVLVVGWLLTALGSVLPIGIVLVAAAIAFVAWRRLARRRTPPAADPPAAAAS